MTSSLQIIKPEGGEGKKREAKPETKKREPEEDK